MQGGRFRRFRTFGRDGRRFGDGRDAGGGDRFAEAVEGKCRRCGDFNGNRRSERAFKIGCSVFFNALFPALIFENPAQHRRSPLVPVEKRRKGAFFSKCRQRKKRFDGGGRKRYAGGSGKFITLSGDNSLN